MKLLLVEDSVRLSRTLETGLRKAGYAIDVALDGTSGLSYALHNPYDVIVLDLMLPGIDGLEILKRLRAENSPARILILTARDTVEERVAGLRAGADDYLVKPFAFEELEARLQSLIRRQYESPSTTIDVGDIRIDLSQKVASIGGDTVDLTRREFSLLEFLALRLGTIVSRFEIQDHLYDEKSFPASNAVDSAVCMLRRKLASVCENPKIKTVRGVGYQLLEEATSTS